MLFQETVFFFFFLQIEKLRIFVLVYVDDILLIGTDAQYIDELVLDLNSQFSLKVRVN